MERAIDREEFNVHIPFCGRWPYWKVWTENLPSLRLTVRWRIHEHRIELDGDKYQLLVRRMTSQRFSLQFQPNSSRLALTHLEVYKFKVELSFEGVDYLMESLDGQRYMVDSQGRVVALFETGWRDSDSDRGIVYWVHCVEGLPELVVAAFFCVAARFDPTERESD